MGDNGVINFKIKFLIDGAQHEMRRFTIDDASFASNYDLFKEKLRAVFPQLRGNVFKVTWTDADNDVITIANDEDLITAIMEMDGVKMLNVLIDKDDIDDEQEQDDEEAHVPIETYNITCDVCNNRITRYRYKCLQCPDYDLCLKCEQAGNHSHHIMMRLANLEIPRAFPKIIGHLTRSTRKAAHHAAKEAHRAAKATARAAHSAAGYAREFRCPRSAPGGGYRGGRAGSGASAAAAASTQSQCPVMPMMEGGMLFDLAETFLGSFARGQNAPGATSATPQATSTASSTNAGQPGGQQQQQQQQQGQQSGEPIPPITPDIFGDVLRNIFSAINGGGPQGATPATTGYSTPATPPVNIRPTNSGTPVGTQTPVAQPASTPSSDVEFISAERIGHPDPVQVPAPTLAPVPTPVTTSVPMDVEQIYPTLASQAPAPDAGWTFVPQPEAVSVTRPNVPIVPAASAPQARPEDAKYAEALAQLRKMGFSDSIDLLALLKRYDGNIGFVVNYLFDNANQK